MYKNKCLYLFQIAKLKQRFTDSHENWYVYIICFFLYIFECDRWHCDYWTVCDYWKGRKCLPGQAKYKESVRILEFVYA